MRMHGWNEETDAVARAVGRYAEDRIRLEPPLDRPASAEDLDRRAGATVTPRGIGGGEALRIWAEVLAPTTISTDHPA